MLFDDNLIWFWRLTCFRNRKLATLTVCRAVCALCWSCWFSDCIIMLIILLAIYNLQGLSLLSVHEWLRLSTGNPLKSWGGLPLNFNFKPRSSPKASDWVCQIVALYLTFFFLAPTASKEKKCQIKCDKPSLKPSPRTSLRPQSCLNLTTIDNNNIHACSSQD